LKAKRVRPPQLAASSGSIISKMERPDLDLGVAGFG
jgi:hypothetical protein